MKNLKLVKLIKFLYNKAYESKFNLKAPLSFIDLSGLKSEIKNVISRYNALNLDFEGAEHRVKTMESVEAKLDRDYDTNLRAYITLNDLLAYRVIVSSYSINLMTLPDDVSIYVFREHGYHAYNLYLQKTPYHYPIEIQVMTRSDYEFSKLSHDILYKQKNTAYGDTIRDMFNQGKIVTKTDLERELLKLKIKERQY